MIPKKKRGDDRDIQIYQKLCSNITSIGLFSRSDQLLKEPLKTISNCFIDFRFQLVDFYFHFVEFRFYLVDFICYGGDGR